MVLVKREEVGRFTFYAYEDDAYDYVEVFDGSRMVENLSLAKCEGPEWENLKNRFKNR